LVVLALQVLMMASGREAVATAVLMVPVLVTVSVRIVAPARVLVPAVVPAVESLVV